MKAINLKRIFFVIAFVLVIGTISVAKYSSINKPSEIANKSPENTPVVQNIVDEPEYQEPKVINIEPPIEEEQPIVNEPVKEEPIKEVPVKNDPVPKEVKEEPIVVESVLGASEKVDESDDEKPVNIEDKDIIVKSKYIGEKKAIEIALKKMGKKAELLFIYPELDGNPPIYKLEIKKNKFIYELEIHAKTGAILSSEKEKVE